MADRFATDVEIGGVIPRSLIPDLINAIQSAGLDLEWNDGTPSEQALRQELEGCDGKATLHVNATELAGGDINPLDEFCVANGIPFTKRVDGKYDYNGEIHWWHPGLSRIQTWSDTDKEASKVMLGLASLKEVLQAGKTLEQVVQQLEKVAPQVPNVQIAASTHAAREPERVGTEPFRLFDL